jgi:hypothetical protein
MQVCGKFHHPPLYLLGKNPGLRLRGLQSRREYIGEEKPFLSISRIEVRPFSRKASKLISVQTTLYRLTSEAYGVIK